jgi:hypothetical protein
MIVAASAYVRGETQMNIEKSDREEGSGMAQRSGSRTMAWIILVMAAAVCFWVAENTRDIRTLRADLRAANDELGRIGSSATAVVSKTDLDTMRADIATLQRQVVRMQDKLARADKTDNETADGSPETAETVPASTDK